MYSNIELVLLLMQVVYRCNNGTLASSKMLPGPDWDCESPSAEKVLRAFIECNDIIFPVRRLT